MIAGTPEVAGDDTAAEREHCVRLPLELTANREEYIENVTRPWIESEFAILGLSGVEEFDKWFRGRFRSIGFTARSSRYYGGIKTMVFEPLLPRALCLSDPLSHGVLPLAGRRGTRRPDRIAKTAIVLPDLESVGRAGAPR